MRSTPIDSPRSLRDVTLEPPARAHPSPSSWRDQVIYFLLPDRFSDGLESERHLFDRDDPTRFRVGDISAWREEGMKFQGGCLRGITSKLDYLKRLGVTTLWIGPVWRQRCDLETYHGYAIQDFLDVDPRFGTVEDLRDLVRSAHERDLYVLLDIVYNHTGNNWFYADPATGRPVETLPYSPFAHSIRGWRSKDGTVVDLPTDRDAGVWPREFQDPSWYGRRGHITRWDPDYWENLLHPENEFRRGDVFELKSLDLGNPDVLTAVTRVYQHWLAVTDCDGFRIDSLKHVTRAASRHFSNAMREFAESIGKENFLLLGEVAGGPEMAREYLEIWGRNIDAVLDIGQPASRLAGMVKGFIDPRVFFEHFDKNEVLGRHRRTGIYHVSVLDDHEMLGREKSRFSAGNHGAHRYVQAAHAVGVQLTTLGIPCIYYGTEQSFDGTQDNGVAGEVSYLDRFVREAMFGGRFGAFQTEGCHFFDPAHPTYTRIAAIAAIRNRADRVGVSLRRGRQYPRELVDRGGGVRLPQQGEIVPWARIHHDQEVVMALNTHGAERRTTEITIDRSLHRPGDRLRVLYRGSWWEDESRGRPVEEVEVTERHGRNTIRVDLAPADMVICA